MKAYDSSAAASGREITLEDIDAVTSNQRAFSKDPAKVMHFVGRVALTLRLAQRRLDDLRNSLERLEMNRQSELDPFTAALTALRTLTPEQKERVLELHVQEQVALAERAQADAQRAQTAAMSEANKVKFTLSKLAEDARLSPEARNAVQEALHAVASARAQVAAPVPQKAPPAAHVHNIPPEFLPPAARATPSDDLSDLFE